MNASAYNNVNRWPNEFTEKVVPFVVFVPESTPPLFAAQGVANEL